MSNIQFQCEKFLSGLEAKYALHGMRYTPLHHRSTPNAYRLSCLSRSALVLAGKDCVKAGLEIAGPFLKLDGARFIEVYC